MARPWYPKYPDDYARKTAHLNFAEHGAYGLLMDQYYRTGDALPADEEALFRVCRGRGRAERKALVSVLTQFFERKNNRLHNARADEELARAQVIHEKRVKGGKARAHAQHMLSTCSEDASAHGQVRARALQPQSHTQEEPLREVSAQSRGIPTRWPSEAEIPEEWFQAGADARIKAGLAPIDLRADAERFKAHFASRLEKRTDWRQAWLKWVVTDYAGQGNGTGFNGSNRGPSARDRVLEKIREAENLRED